MATGILSKGATLSYMKAAVLTELTDLQEIPELGGSVDKVEVTTLADSAKRYINGLKDYGDLSFKFLYDNSSATSSYRILQGLEVAETVQDFTVTFPDGTTFQFDAFVSVVVDSAAVGAALTFTLNLTLNSEIAVGNPV